MVYDGSGQPPTRQDVGVTRERMSCVGDAAEAGPDAAVVVDVGGLMITPGFIYMHSHAEQTEDSAVTRSPSSIRASPRWRSGVDGAGTPDVAELFAGLEGRVGGERVRLRGSRRDSGTQ